MSVGATTSAAFERDVLQAQGPVLVDFWAAWCAPCRALAPLLDEIQAEYPGRIRILKVDIEESPDLALAYRVTSIPTIKLFRNGLVEASIVGARSKSALIESLAAYLA